MAGNNILVWFRRDLRLDDHAALSAAMAAAGRVWCVFVFDLDILDPLLARGLRKDRRVVFIHRSLLELDVTLRRRGGGLMVRHGSARDEIPRLADKLGVDAVFANRDYEPAALVRDETVTRKLSSQGRQFRTFKDQVVFERDEILTLSGAPYAVFTPYRNAWLRKLCPAYIEPHVTHSGGAMLMPPPDQTQVPAVEDLGFEFIDAPPGGSGAAQALFADFLDRIDEYTSRRNFPALNGGSGLSPHLRFGTISVRQLVRQAYSMELQGNKGAATWLDELIWREFYQMILWHHPRVVDGAFKRQCSALEWDDVPALFDVWRQGLTGYPLVDAAMRQIAQTGFMHNRLRMLVASFLCKDLGIDWRCGEQYFADQLVDFDLASNNGGWQWAASTGCDAQPWFRIFNPVTQSEKFDAEGVFIRRYVNELDNLPATQIHAPWRMSPAEQQAYGILIGRDYPAPVVDHAVARLRTLERYRRIGRQ